MYDIIKEYKRLLDEGVITEEEFENKKREVLGMPSKEEELQIAEQKRIREEEQRKVIEREKRIEAEHQRKLEEARLAEREHQRKVEEVRLAEQERIRKQEEQKQKELEEKRKKKEEKKTSNKGIIKLIIVAIVAIVLIIGVFVVLSGNDNGDYDDGTDYNAVYNWPSSGLASSVPQPDVETGEIMNHHDTMMDFYLYKATLDDFEAYVSECKEAGYNDIDKESDTYYRAYNEEKTHYINIEYYEDDKKMYIVIRAQEDWTEIHWPKNELASLIPQPQKLVGKVTIDSSDSIIVKIANVSTTEYNDYIDECIDAGFDVNYDRYDKSFSAEDANGNELNVYFEEFNVMEIWLDAA